MSHHLYKVESLESRILFDTWWVDDVATNGNGSQASPFNSLQAALNHANTGPGDTINVKSGTYRAYSMVQQNKHGDATGYLTIQKAPGDAGAAVFKGSDLVTGWTIHSGSIWKKTGWLTDSQQVFDDGAFLRQVKRPPGALFDPNANDGDRLPDVDEGTTVANMSAGSFFYDEANDTLYAWLADGSNPNNSVMEASVRRRVFFAEPTRGYIKIDGLTFEHSNAAFETEQEALITLGNNSIFQNSIARWGDLAGLSMGDTVGTQVINSQFLNNGGLGITAPGTDNYIIKDSVITGNNYRNMLQFWHAGGIKVTSGAYGLVENNVIANNNGSGLWFDYANSNNVTNVRDNYLHNNSPYEGAMFVEASKFITIYNNVMVNNNRRGVFVSGSDQTKVYNNTIVGQQGIAGIDVIARNGVNSTNTTIRNNIISGGTGTWDIRISGGGAGNTSNNNNIYRSTGAKFNNGSDKTFTTWKQAGFDGLSFDTNPSFATATGDSYTLSSTSPGRDTGTTIAGVTTDYIGTARPQGTAYDMGAYEYFSTLSTNLVAYWRLNENTGVSTADASTGGVVSDTGTLTNGPTWTTGQSGSAVSFDGVNDRVSVADSADLDATTAITIGGWFKHAASGGSGTAGIQKLNAYRLTAQEANQASSKWQFYFVDSSGVSTRQITTTNAYSNGVWHYVMATFDGSQLKIYVDGVSAATPVNYSGSINVTTTGVQLGQRDSTAFYKGEMDEIRIYKRALSATEISDLYSGGGTAMMMMSSPTSSRVPSQSVFSKQTITDDKPEKKRSLIASL